MGEVAALVEWSNRTSGTGDYRTVARDENLRHKKRGQTYATAGESRPPTAAIVVQKKRRETRCEEKRLFLQEKGRWKR